MKSHSLSNENNRLIGGLSINPVFADFIETELLLERGLLTADLLGLLAVVPQIGTGEFLV